MSYAMEDLFVCFSYILDHLSYRLERGAQEVSLEDKGELKRYLLKQVEERLAEQEKRSGGAARMNEFMRVAVLSAVDDAWVEQVDYMQQLQAAVSGRSTAQRNLLFEYQNDSFEASNHVLSILVIFVLLVACSYFTKDQRIL